MSAGWRVGGAPTDETVVVDGSAGPGRDRDAEFADFVRATTVELGRVAWFLCGDPTRAEDLLQQAYLRTWTAWPRVRAGDPTAYTRRVLANLRIDGWRKDRREVLTATEDLPRGAVPASADRQADRDLLVRALLTLPARQRRVVVLRHLLDLSEAEVAADLGVSVGTVKSTASRGLHRLRVALDGSPGVPGTTHTTDATGTGGTRPPATPAGPTPTGAQAHPRRQP